MYEEDEQDVISKMDTKALDEDADVDECDDWDAEAIEVYKTTPAINCSNDSKF